VKILRTICSINPAAGGPMEGIRSAGLAMAKLGHCTEVACLDAPNAAWLQQFPLKVHALGPGLSKYHFSRKFVPWLQQHASQYDYIIIDGIWQYSSFGTWLALRNLSMPYFVYPHGMLDPWFKHTYPLKHLKKWLYWPWADYRVLRDAKAVLFTTHEEKELARQSFWLYHCNETVVNFGTSAPSGNPEQLKHLFFNQFPTLKDKQLVLFLGRIHPKKGCDLLIDAFARIVNLNQNLHLVMAGPDQVGWQQQLDEQAKKLNIAHRITWTGLLEGDYKWGALHAANVFVLPSHQENFGVAVVEAMACGLPVLISNKVNIYKEIEIDQAGLVADDTADQIRLLLHRWLSMSTKESQLMRERAKQSFVKRFEMSQAVQNLMQTLSSI
jgi:glycosyltransferase involved in cell wall biosynthesis